MKRKKEGEVDLLMLLNHRIEHSGDSKYAMAFFFFFDPENWKVEKYHGNDAITSFANHFRATLTAARYD